MRKVLIMLMMLSLIVAPNVFAIETGSEAPDFTLTDTNGESHSLSDFSGKHVVLEWINPDCPFVKKHYSGANMQNLQYKFIEEGVTWLSIASSAPGKQGHYSPAEWNQIMGEQDIQSIVLLDPDGTVGRLYSAKTTPHMYLINPEGDLVYQGAIDSKRSANPKDIETAENYIQAALQQSLGGESITNDTTKPYGCSVKY